MIKFFCPRWGFEKLEWKSFLSRIKTAGYHGIEWFPFGETVDYIEFLKELNRQNLQLLYVFAVQDDRKGFDFGRYQKLLKEQLRKLLDIQLPDLSPLHISVQAGREFFNKDQVLACLEICRQLSVEYRIPIYQETHRNKWSYAAHAVYPVMQQVEDLELTLDISHWFCVSESYLEDQQDAVLAAISRARHIHARVGSTETPQVFDPALPAYKEALAHQLSVWDKWVSNQKITGKKITITPEFGPPPYLTITSSNESDSMERQWQLNLWMMNLLRERYL